MVIDDKRRFDVRVNQLEEELEEEQMNYEALNEKFKKLSTNYDQIVHDYSVEKENNNQLEVNLIEKILEIIFLLFLLTQATRNNLERQLREFREQREGNDGSVLEISKSKVAGLEAKIRGLEEQLDNELRYARFFFSIETILC